MIEAIRKDDLAERTSKRGPRIGKTATAQAAVDEFLQSGLDACKVEWEPIDPDYDMAKRAVAYRINHSKESGLEGAEDLGMRSNRGEGEIYLVHLSRMS